MYFFFFPSVAPLKDPFKMLICPCNLGLQGATQAEQVPHPFPDSGHFRKVSRADGRALSNNADRHQLRSEREHSGEGFYSPEVVHSLIYRRGRKCKSSRLLDSDVSPWQGISAHTEELLKHLNYIGEARSKGLVVFSWGDDNNEHENRRKLREQGIDGLIYDR